VDRRPRAPGGGRQGEDAGGPAVEEEGVGQPDEGGVSFRRRCGNGWLGGRGEVLPWVDHYVVRLPV